MRLSIIGGLALLQVSQLVSAQDPLNIPRPHIGNVPYGTIIQRCNSPGKIALTFDDGPSQWTPTLLDILSSLNAKATFFVTGLGSSGPITEPMRADLLSRTHAEGHQIANHGWTHASLPSLSYDGQRNEIVEVEEALQSILGFIPTYYRCAYLECDSASGLPILNELGYHVISVNLDTKDYQYNSPDQIQNAQANFANGVSYNPGQDSYISLAHDIHYHTVFDLARFMVETARERGYELVTVGECLDDPRENWYRGGGSVTEPPPTTFVTSTVPAGPTGGGSLSPDGSCGVNGGFTCQGSSDGNCCSKWGWCGSGDDYCGTGCNSAFGSCN